MKRKNIFGVLLVVALTALSLLAFTVLSLAETDMTEEQTVVFVSNAGKSSNDGLTAQTPINSLTTAFNRVVDGGVIVVCGARNVSTNFNTPKTNKDITITSVWDGVDYRVTNSAALVFQYNMYLNGNTTIENINITVAANNLALACNNNKVVIGDGVECSFSSSSVTTPLSIIGGTYANGASYTRSDDTNGIDLTINSGTWRMIRAGHRSSASSAINGDVKLTINGGTYTSYILGGGATNITGDVSVTINDGTFTSLVSASYKNSEAVGSVGGNVTMTINGGTFLSDIHLALSEEEKVSGTGTLTITGGNFASVSTISGSGCTGETTIDYSEFADKATISSKITSFDALIEGEIIEPDDPGIEEPGETVVFVSDYGSPTNTGASVSSPINSLTTAFEKVAEGGTIVVCGPKTVAINFNTPICNAPITITSVYNGVDYRSIANASLIFNYSMFLNGETTFENIDIAVGANNLAIACNSNKVTIGDNVNCTLNSGITTYLSIIGGTYAKGTAYSSSDDTQGADLTINSGTWRMIRAGHRSSASSAVTDDMMLTINGGTFESYVLGGGATNITGDVYVTINGGTFKDLVSASTKDSEAIGNIDGNVTLTINGGTFYNSIYLAMSDSVKVTGSGTLVISGGDFAQAPAIKGYDTAKGSSIDYTALPDKSSLSGKLFGFDIIVSGEVLLGDFNANGYIDNSDLSTIIRYLSGWETAQSAIDIADINGDGKINNRDALNLIVTVSGGKRVVEAGWNSLRYESSNGIDLTYQLWMPEAYDAEKEYPIILYMHSSGVRCDDNGHIYTAEAKFLRNLEASEYANEVIVLAPACPVTDKWVPANAWNEILYDYENTAPTRYMQAATELFALVKTTYSIDLDRQYTYGMSMGAFAVYDLLTRNPDTFAAAIPVAGAGDYEESAISNFEGTAMWIFHGDSDTSVPVESSRNMVEALRAVGRDDVLYTEFEGAGHGIWVMTADTEGLLDWLFSQSKQ